MNVTLLSPWETKVISLSKISCTIRFLLDTIYKCRAQVHQSRNESLIYLFSSQMVPFLMVASEGSQIRDGQTFILDSDKEVVQDLRKKQQPAFFLLHTLC